MKEGVKSGFLLIYQQREVKEPWAFSLEFKVWARGTQASVEGWMLADWLPFTNKKLWIEPIEVHDKAGRNVVGKLAKLAAMYGRPMIKADLDQVRSEVEGKMEELRKR